jgi:transcriptional regulator with XRE-family HTH domain
MNKRMLGDAICRLRKAKGLSRSELAKLIGVRNESIRNWELHEDCPHIVMVQHLTQILGDFEGSLFLYYYDFVIGGYSVQKNVG